MADDEMEVNGKPAAGRPFHRKKRVLIPTALVVIVAILAVSYWYLYLRGYVATDDAFVDGDAITISSRILGRVTRLSVDEGDTVTQGQLLVQLDDSDLQAQKAQAEAGLAYAEQNVPVAKINLDRSQDDFDRASFQYKEKVITREQYDHASKALQMTQAQFKLAQSQVNTAAAQLNVVETQLRNTRISASIPGVVARKWVVTGDIVQAGQPIFTLYDLDSVWVTANFEETKLSSIVTGDPVEITVDAYPDRAFSGRVQLISAAAASQFSLIPPNNASGNFTKVTQRVPVKISIDGPGKEDLDGRSPLRPGMSAEVKIRVRNR
jgi:membrane fusion protein (multidrug efflux system)